jgi:hypothetical protein
MVAAASYSATQFFQPVYRSAFSDSGDQTVDAQSYRSQQVGGGHCWQALSGSRVTQTDVRKLSVERAALLNSRKLCRRYDPDNSRIKM